MMCLCIPKYIYDIVSLLISVLVPIFVMFITLHSEKKRHTSDVQRLQKEHDQILRQSQEQHNEVLSLQKEVNRVAVMPYLEIQKAITAYPEPNGIVFEIDFTNVGNGTAIELTGSYFTKDDFTCCLSQTATALYICGIPFDFTTSVVSPKGQCKLGIKRLSKEKELNFSDEVHFGIKYVDMFQNHYEQRFMFSFVSDKSLEILRVQTYSPKQI